MTPKWAVTLRVRQFSVLMTGGINRVLGFRTKRTPVGRQGLLLRPLALLLRRGGSLVLALGMTLAAPGLAQVAAGTNSGLPTREAIDQSRREPAPLRPRLTVEGDIERSPCALADPAYAAIKVTLTAATFNNLGPVAAADLAPAYAGDIGVERPISVVCDIRDAAATILRAKGYLAAVQVPAQRIEGGRVGFEVLYARLTAVRVRGDAGRNENLVARYLDHLATGTQFNRFAAERWLLLARDIPGFAVRLALKPAGTGPGDMIGEVSVVRTPIEIDVNIQNYAPPETGRYGGQVRAQFYGLTGMADRTSISVFSTADFGEQQVLQIGHDFALGGSGLRVGGRFTYAWTHPGLGPGVPDVRARTLFANLEASYPLVRSQALSLAAAGGFDFVNQDVRFGGLPLSQDRLRVVYAKLDADAVDMRGVGPGGTIGWRLDGTLELRQGVGIFGASPNCLANPGACVAAGLVPPGLIDGDPKATVLRFNGAAEVRIARAITIAVLPRAQVSSAPVFSFEQFSGGNYTIGRGYDPGTLTGDSGIGVAAELRYDRFSVLPEQEIGAQPFVFVDTAWVWNRGTPPGLDPQRLTSLGAGARIGWADKARIDVTLAVPVQSAGRVQSGDVRFLVSLTTRLVPWRTR